MITLFLIYVIFIIFVTNYNGPNRGLNVLRDISKVSEMKHFRNKLCIRALLKSLSTYKSNGTVQLHVTQKYYANTGQSIYYKRHNFTPFLNK